MAPNISSSEVKKHNNSESTWMVIHNDVYDVTTFLNEHPGGPDSLLEFAGLDGTTAFEDVGHSSDAREMMRKYKIGTLPLHERTKEIPICSNLKWALLALAGAIVIGFVLKKYVA